MATASTRFRLGAAVWAIIVATLLVVVLAAVAIYFL
jgi:hypothetical protein